MGELDSIQKKLISFYKKYNDLYIYGAGKYAKFALQVCEGLGIKVRGFVTTEYEKEMYCGLPVLVADKVNIIKKSDMGIIPGFMRFSKNTCKKLISDAQTLDVNPKLFKLMIEKVLVKKISDSFPDKRECESIDDEQDRILVIRLDAIGDLVCTTPLFKAIKENNDKTELSVIIQKGNRAILDNNPYIDKVYEFDGQINDSETEISVNNIDEVLETAKEFITESAINDRYRRVYIPMHFLEGRNAYITLALSKAVKSQSIISWVKANEQVNKHQKEVAKELPVRIITINEPMHEKDFILTMAKGVGIDALSDKLQLFPREEEPYIDSVIKRDNTKRVFVAVGVVGRRETQSWKSENYKELFASLSDKKIVFVLFGAADAISASEKIGKSDNVINLINKTTLEQTIYAIKKCDMYLGSNTGLLHIAAALNKPCVTIYSASKEVSPWDAMGPVRWGAKDVRHIDLLPDHCLEGCEGSCSKSYSHCINQITIKEVRDAIYSLLKTTPSIGC